MPSAADASPPAGPKRVPRAAARTALAAIAAIAAADSRAKAHGGRRPNPKRALKYLTTPQAIAAALAIANQTP